MPLQSVFIAATLVTTAIAQEPAIVKTEILAVALDQPIDDLFINAGSGIEPFSANLTGFGIPIAYQGPQRLVLHETAEAFAPAPGEKPPEPAAAVDLPLRSDRVVLVCIQPPEGKLKLIAYDISKTTAKPGDYRFFNFSTQQVSIIIGPERLTLAPGKDTVASHGTWGDEVLDLDVQLGASAQGKRPAKRVYASVWGHRPGRRNYVFMFDGSHPSKPITMRRFYDIPPAAAAP